MNKQFITKQNIINLLNDMKNKINENTINQYINRLLTLDDETFEEELDSNNISTMEDVELLFKDRLSKATCTLSDLDFEESYFHFTDKHRLASIIETGLKSNIGEHSIGIDEEPSIFFTYGMIPTLQGADVWIKWVMHKMYGEANKFGFYNGMDESEIKLKQHEWYKEFLNGEYLTDSVKKEKTFDLLYNSLKEKILFTINLKSEMDFSFDDIDYTKKRALDAKANGDNTKYLYMKAQYGEYSNTESTVMDKWNMHTFFGTNIEYERLMQVTDSKGRTDFLHILIEMYDKCKSYNDFTVDILEDFISYAKQKEISTEKVFTKKLVQESLKNIPDLTLLDEIEHVKARKQRELQEQREEQDNLQSK